MANSFDPSRMRQMKTISHTAGLLAGVFDPTSQRFVAGTTDGHIMAWPFPDWSEPATFRWSHRSWIYSLAVLPKQGCVLSVGLDRRLIWWDAKEGVPLREVQTEGRPLQVAVSPDERWVAVVDDDRWLRLYDAVTGEMAHQYGGHPERTMKAHLSSVYCAAFSPDGRLIATADRTGTTLVRELDGGRVIHELRTPNFYIDYRIMSDGTPNPDGEYELGGVRFVIFAPDSQLVIVGGMADYDYGSAGTDGKMGLVGFDVATGSERFACKLPKDKGYLQAAQFHPSGLMIAAGGGGTGGDTGLGAICVLDLAKPNEPVAHSCEMTIRALAIAPAGDQLIVTGMLKSAVVGQTEVWDLPSLSL